MPRTPADPMPGVTYEEEHVVDVCWEPECPEAADGLCDRPECDPETVGVWLATCHLGDFMVDAPADRHADLWTLSEQHEKDPTVGLDLEHLAADTPA